MPETAPETCCGLFLGLVDDPPTDARRGAFIASGAKNPINARNDGENGA